LDTESLEFSNDFDQNGPLGQCLHGYKWDSCRDPQCQEIWNLCQEQAREHLREIKGKQQTRRPLKERGEKTPQYEIALEEESKSRFLDEKEELRGDDEVTVTPWVIRRFADIFPNDISIRAAIQFKALTQRGGKILRRYLEAEKEAREANKELILTALWEKIGQEVGCSAKTVGREFIRLIERFFVERNVRPPDFPGHIKLVRVRGERRPRFYRIHSVQFGKWRQVWSELITDRSMIRDLRKKGHLPIQSSVVPLRSSPVNRLFGDLIATFGEGLLQSKGSPDYISPRDWEYNLKRAKRLLSGKNHRAGPWAASDVYRIIGRGSTLCKACHTPLLRGFKINDRLITRRRQFCDDACKMNSKRQLQCH